MLKRTDTAISMNPSRFQWIVEGMSLGSDPIFDVDLTPDNELFATVPTLGSIVPGWLLLIPRVRALCFADTPTEVRNEALPLAFELGDRVKLPGERVYVFEHGASTFSSPIGCGVEHAHLHVVPLAFDLLSAMAERTDTTITNRASMVFPISDAIEDYYFATDGDRTAISKPSEKVSQFFRKIIADQTGQPDQWDYGLSKGQHNARETVERYCKR